MSKRLDPAAAEREPDIFPADVGHLGAQLIFLVSNVFYILNKIHLF